MWQSWSCLRSRRHLERSLIKQPHLYRPHSRVLVARLLVHCASPNLLPPVVNHRPHAAASEIDPVGGVGTLASGSEPLDRGTVIIWSVWEGSNDANPERAQRAIYVCIYTCLGLAQSSATFFMHLQRAADALTVHSRETLEDPASAASPSAAPAAAATQVSNLPGYDEPDFWRIVLVGKDCPGTVWDLRDLLQTELFMALQAQVPGMEYIAPGEDSNTTDPNDDEDDRRYLRTGTTAESGRNLRVSVCPKRCKRPRFVRK